MTNKLTKAQPYWKTHSRVGFAVDNREYHKIKRVGEKFGGMSAFARHCVMKELKKYD